MQGIIKNRYGQTLGIVHAKPKTFKTGNKGFLGFEKLTDPETGKCYVIHLQLVEQKPVETIPQNSKHS